MKKFIMAAPQQKPGGLRKSVYKPEGNELLTYEKQTAFPLIPVLNAYADEEKVQIIVIRQDDDNCRSNSLTFEEELKNLSCEKGFTYDEIKYIEIPKDEKVDTHISTFQKLIDCIDDEDELYACITYGSKPVPIVVSMALRYAEAIMENSKIKCVVYGATDWAHPDNEHLDANGRPTYPMSIFDVTALLIVSNIVEILKDNKVKNVKEVLKAIIDL